MDELKLQAPGWKLVPINPNKGMLDAIWGKSSKLDLLPAYYAMLDAAPAAPVMPNDAVGRVQSSEPNDEVVWLTKEPLSNGVLLYAAPAAQQAPAAPSDIPTWQARCKEAWPQFGLKHIDDHNKSRMMLNEIDELRAAMTTASAPSDIRSAALEEAAKVCENVLDATRPNTTSAYAYFHATAIRARKSIAGPVASAAHQLAVPELSNAFITIESRGEGRIIALKFNHSDDAYAVHDFLLKGGGKDYMYSVPAPVQQAAPSEDGRVRDLECVIADLKSECQELNGRVTQLARAVCGLLPLCGWNNFDADDLTQEACLGNGAAQYILYARAAIDNELGPRAAAPAQPVFLSEQDSIDTPEFQRLMHMYRLACFDPYSNIETKAVDQVRAAIVAHIDATKVGKQDKLDAARWQWLESVHFSVEFDGGDNMPYIATSLAYQGLDTDFVTWVRSKVDAAILAAKAGAA